MNVIVTLWDFLGPGSRRENMIQRWAKHKRLSHRDRALLNQKFDFLESMGFEIAQGTRLIAGPINKRRKIYKFIVHGDVMLRPMLCKGPPEKQDREVTVLEGAIEKDWKLDPENAPERAEQNRQVILNDRQRRGPHERF